MPFRQLDPPRSLFPRSAWFVLRALWLNWIVIGVSWVGNLRAGEQLPSLPLPEFSGELRSWKFVVIHHSATESGSVESIDTEHRQRRDSQGIPWLGIGYHFVIGNGRGLPDGSLQATFRWREQRDGAHAGVRLYNEFGLGICLIGDFENLSPTAAQLRTLSQLLQRLQEQLGIGPEQIVVHADLKATACPGKLFLREAVPELLNAVEQHRPPSRFTPVRPGITEENTHAVSAQRAAGFRRPAPEPVSPQ